jgi:hypothetical protein
MEGTIEEGITTIVDIDIDMVIIIIMGTVIIMDVAIELHQVAMGIIETGMTIIDTDLTGTTIDPILIIEIEAIIQEVTTVRQDLEQQVEDTDKTLTLLFLMKGFSSYPEIISRTFPTINPPKVPIIYPIIAMSTPMGIRALE